MTGSRLWFSVPWLWPVFLVGALHVSGGEEPSLAAVVPPGKIEVFPGYSKFNGEYKYTLLKNGETYGLTLKHSKIDKTWREALWVHRVTKFWPHCITRDELMVLGRKLDFGQSQVRAGRVGAKEALLIDGIPGRLALRTCGYRIPLLRFESSELNRVGRIRSMEEYDALNKNLTREQMAAIAKQELERINLWPKDIQERWYQCASHKRMFSENVELDCLFHYCGNLDGFRVGGQYQNLQFVVTCTGKLGSFEITWHETEPHALLEAKTIEEGFEALNRGWAEPLPRVDAMGGTVELLEILYVPDGPGCKYLIPVYHFGVESEKVSTFVLVPAIKSAYFKNPKRQVLVAGMEEEAKAQGATYADVAAEKEPLKDK